MRPAPGSPRAGAHAGRSRVVREARRRAGRTRRVPVRFRHLPTPAVARPDDRAEGTIGAPGASRR
ncbi:hypothetical protein SZ28_01315 [Burkholderia pseudomallei]|nr:conserved hypothetical protein [Burkholderia pseudomallei Pakistan 9]KIX45868.1 hypothetical protein SZ28_01315 [Burkholderia pseudomallei]ONB83029.1 hypothetical protein AQ907_10090 [Burkholderia pseudomallei]RAQ84045.1 hypothetical protein A4G85_01215 [Burkholderia pseudomallei]